MTNTKEQFKMSPINTFCLVSRTCFQVGAHRKPDILRGDGSVYKNHGVFSCSGKAAYFDTRTLAYACGTCKSLIIEEVIDDAREFRNEALSNGGFMRMMLAYTIAFFTKTQTPNHHD